MNYREFQRHRDQRSVPTGICEFPGCERPARDGFTYCFKCRRKVEDTVPDREGRT